MIAYREAVYLKNQCAKLDIRVTAVVEAGGIVRLNIMDHEFADFDQARRFVQTYQADQGARWAAYNQARRQRRIQKWTRRSLEVVS